MSKPQGWPTIWPHPTAYQLSCDYFHAPAAEIVFVSSNSWDISGATHFGFWTIWVNRTGAPADILGVKPVAVVSSLTEIPAALPHLT
ncbi:MAG: hypothetical protein OWU33_02425 [Firmicutes bacterium]|nr:hypothetical protein [Bacillota bacterium]